MNGIFKDAKNFNADVNVKDLEIDKILDLLPGKNPVDLKSTAGTNFCDIFIARNGKALFINSSIDNLLRGASSQAVVNANLMCGYEESLGIPKIAYVP